MEDDHVDRPGMEVRQRMKFTGTNSSIGLIVLIIHVHLTSSDVSFALAASRPCEAEASQGDSLEKAHKDQRIARSGSNRFSLFATCYSLKTASRIYVRFADLVVIAERLHPIPFRTRP